MHLGIHPRVPLLQDRLCSAKVDVRKDVFPLKKMIGNHYFESVEGIHGGIGKDALKYTKRKTHTPLEETYTAESLVEGETVRATCLS